MAISNELSSEIAVAILTENKSPQELNQLKEVVLQVHFALQQMSEDSQAGSFSGRNFRNGFAARWTAQRQSSD